MNAHVIGIGNEEETALVVYENNDYEASINCHENDELEEEARNQLLAMRPLKRPSSQSSDVWKHIRLMDNMDIRRLEKDRKHYCTHYCTHCGHCMSLPSNESRSKKRISYTSTKANTHLLTCPEFSNEEYKSEKLRAKRVKIETTLDTTVKNLEEYDSSFAAQGGPTLVQDFLKLVNGPPVLFLFFSFVVTQQKLAAPLG